MFSSGGSSGVRGVYVWDWEQFVTLACLAWRWQVRAERASGSADRPARLAVLEAGEPPHASTPLFDVATRAVDADRRDPGGRAVRAGAARGGGRPADPSRRLRLGDRTPRPCRDRGRARHPAGSGEHQLRTAQRGGSRRDRRPPGARPSTTSGARPRSASRQWAAAYGDGLHICEDEVILERVDPAGRPVGPDEPAARTLATGLAGRTFPFIRYDLGDEVTLLPGRCACGSSMPRVADIAGRRDDDFHYGGADGPGQRVPLRARHRPADLGVPGAADSGRGGRARGRVARRRRGGRGAGRRRCGGTGSRIPTSTSASSGRSRGTPRPAS